VGFHAVTTVEEALEALADLGDGARVLAGGTDVMIQRMSGELPAGEDLVWIGGIESLRGIEVGDGLVTIGALTTHRQMVESEDLRRHLPSLVEAAGTVGGWQTQQVGTIGGNLCNASPAADLAAPILMCGATMVVVGPHGERRVGAEEFFEGRRMTAVGTGELLTSVEVPLPPSGSWERYFKVGRRSAMEVAIVGLAARIVVDGGVVGDARLAFCSVAVRPVRAAAAEQALVGRPLGEEAAAEAARLAAAALSPIDDQRATAAYRKKVTGNLVAEAVRIAGRAS
jgi:CO/xanthine dehydrogenase FAD-binding subunit